MSWSLGSRSWLMSHPYRRDVGLVALSSSRWRNAVIARYRADFTALGVTPSAAAVSATDRSPTTRSNRVDGWSSGRKSMRPRSPPVRARRGRELPNHRYLDVSLWRASPQGADPGRDAVATAGLVDGAVVRHGEGPGTEPAGIAVEGGDVAGELEPTSPRAPSA
jgi:hypothetical protein